MSGLENANFEPGTDINGVLEHLLDKGSGDEGSGDGSLSDQIRSSLCDTFGSHLEQDVLAAKFGLTDEQILSIKKALDELASHQDLSIVFPQAEMLSQAC